MVPDLGDPEHALEDTFVSWVEHLVPAADQVRLLGALRSIISDDGILADRRRAESEMEQVFTADPMLLYAVAAGALQASAMKPLLLLASMLVTAISAFEALIGGLVTEHLHLHPDALDRNAYRFTLKELEEFDSLPDAFDEAVDRRVESLLRKDLVAWSQWSDKTLGRSFDDWYLDRHACAEAFLRRHAIVHTAGVASRRYLREVTHDFRVPLGAQLTVDAPYLLQAVDEIEALGGIGERIGET
jgi:hypothetical protein